MDFLHTRSALLVYLHTIWQLHMFNEVLLESKTFSFFSQKTLNYTKGKFMLHQSKLEFLHISNSERCQQQDHKGFNHSAMTKTPPPRLPTSSTPNQV